MATPNVGTGVTISLSQVNTELEQGSTSRITMDDYKVRALCGKMSGRISMEDLSNKRYKLEKHLGDSSVGGSNNSGGTFDLNHWGWFVPGVEITRCQIISASKYEWSLYIHQFGGNGHLKGGGMHYLPYPWTYNMNRYIDIPGSADYHTTSYWGWKLYPDGLNK